MIHLVHSVTGTPFWVDSDPRSHAFDTAFAATKSDFELDAHGDFQRGPDLVELLPASVYTVADPPEPVPVEALGRAARLWGRADYVLGDKP